jgi:lysophospholipase L1-like esterase
VLFAAVSCTPLAAPTPPDDGPLLITCPASVTAPSPNGGPADVVYEKPRVSGGVQPIQTSCTPTVGASFDVGTTPVACTTADGTGATASCGFDVSVVVPTLPVTSFMAFGDSITWGSNGMCERGFDGDPTTWAFQDLQSLFANVNPPSAAYPGVLEALLESRYRAQSFTVANEGLPGEAVTNSNTFPRFLNALDTHQPEVLLLQEGVNDLHAPSSRRPSPAAIAAALGTMVREAKGRGIEVFLGTILPERVGACRAFGPERIPPANVEIRALAARENVALVDLYQAFVGQESTLLDQDGLHPSVAGYARMAEAFFDAIRATLEAP